MKMTFIGVPASKKIIEKSLIIIIDFRPNSISNSAKRIPSSGRDEIERGRSPSSDLSILKGGISKKDRKVNAVEAGDEFARLTDILIEISDLKAEKKGNRIQDCGKKTRIYEKLSKSDFAKLKIIRIIPALIIFSTVSILNLPTITSYNGRTQL
jgi:hypothetical protein